MKTSTPVSRVAALLVLAGCDAKQLGATAAPAPALAAAVNTLPMCADPVHKEIALSAATAKDILEISAIGADCRQATVLTTVHTVAGILLWSHADVASETMAFAGEEESKAPAGKSVHDIMAAWAGEAAVSTTANAPDWKQGAARPEGPTGLGYFTDLDRADYLLVRKEARPMLCHPVYLNRTLCVIYFDGAGAAPYATEYFDMRS